MAANGNSAQQWIPAVDEIRSGGEIVDNLARMSEATVLLARGLRACVGKYRACVGKYRACVGKYPVMAPGTGRRGLPA
jgi:hypothetical protein